MSLADRPTADIVLIIITLLVALIVVLSGAGVFILALLHPEYDLSVAYSSLGSVVTLLTGTVIGYLAGRGRSAQSQER